MTDDPSPATGPARARGSGTLALLALAWVLAVVSSARFTIGDAPPLTPVTLSRMAGGFPQVVSAALVAGVAVGLAAVDVLARAARSVLVHPLRRVAVSGSAGLVLAAALTLMIMTGYGGLPTVRTLTITVAAAAALGGLLAGAGSRAVLAAGVAGALTVFAVRFAAGFADAGLLTVFGAGESPRSVLTASTWTVLTIALVAGAAAGAVSYGYLRRAGPTGLSWPGYLLAGALPGLLALLAEVATQVGGARLFGLAAAASPDERLVQEFLATARVNQALAVLFAGALVATVLRGRSLPAAVGSGGSTDPDDPDGSAQSSS